MTGPTTEVAQEEDITPTSTDVARIQSEWITPTATTTPSVQSDNAVSSESAQEYQLVAIDGPQLVSAHARMIRWAEEQIVQVKAELKEESANLKIAKERKWATATFQKRVAMLEKRIPFYEKIKLALEMGAVIVPNFEMTVFAVRTTAAVPGSGRSEGYGNTRGFVHTSAPLPAGEGEYKNPQLGAVQRESSWTDAKGEKHTNYYQVPLHQYAFPEMAFPIALAKPAIMTRTAESMLARVFDEIGVATDTQTGKGRRPPDPIILGRLKNPLFYGDDLDPVLSLIEPSVGVAANVLRVQ